MTVNQGTIPSQYNGDGSTTSFTVSFDYAAKSDVVVVLTDSNGSDTTWTLDTQYSLSDPGSTGTLTVDTSPTDYTPQSGEVLTIYPSVTYEQTASFANQSEVKTAFDKQERQIQNLKFLLDKAPKQSLTTETGALTFPEPSDGKGIGWDGTVLANIDVKDIYVQASAPTGNIVPNSLWIDSDSTDYDLYQYTAGSWSDTGVDLKGATSDLANFPETGYATPQDHVSSNMQSLIESLYITTATSARFGGAYRQLVGSELNWYFIFSAFYHAPEVFTQTKRLAALDLAINRGVVAPREDSSAYSLYAMVRFSSGKTFYCSTAGTTAGSEPSDASATVQGNTVSDGTVTWTYTGKSLPTEWSWVLVDFDSDLVSIADPDSNDAYAGLLAAAVLKASPTSDWLNESSSFPSKSRMDVIAAVLENSITDQLATAGGGKLSKTFQSDKTGSGATYDLQLIADNTEVWRGLSDLSTLHTKVGETSEATTAASNAADVKNGILSLWSGGRFKTYPTQSNHTSITGDAAFVTDFRFHYWPALFGMWDTITEFQTYGDAVLAYTVANTPGLYTESLDSFPMTEWFLGVGLKSGWRGMWDMLCNRVTERASSAVLLSDAAICVAVSATYSQVNKDQIDLTSDVADQLPVANGGTGASTASAALTALGLQEGISSTITLGPATLDLTSTTAVQIGTTPSTGRFIPLEIILLCTAASSPTSVNSASLGVGITASGYNETFFSFLDSSFDAEHEFYRYSLPASATAPASYPASSDLYAKLGAAIGGGTMSAKIWVRGFIGN